MDLKSFRYVIHSFNDSSFFKYFYERIYSSRLDSISIRYSKQKDFQNLLSVYLDAAFAANLNPLDFAQEGIRIELENGQPVYKGVVFNEMKGAMSAPSDQLYHQLAHHLFPETTYHYNSGGDLKIFLI